MRHYESTDAGSSKFWEIELHGSSVTVRYGRLGTRGRKQTWQFSSRDEAKRDWEKRIAKKTRGGYRLTFVDGSDTSSDIGDDVELVRNAELEAAVLANPADDEQILVYGDWLAERGDPRGQVILTYVRMHAESDPAKFVALKKHAQQTIADHSHAFYGRLIEYTDRVRIRWRLGFFDDVRIHRRQDEPPPAETLDALLDAPATFLLRVLTIDDFDRRSTERLMQAHLPVLRTLKVWLPGSDGVPADLRLLAPLFDLEVAPMLSRLEITEPPDGDWLLSALASAPIARQLTHLSISYADIYSGSAELLALRFPKLRSFELEHCDLDDEFIEELRAQLPGS